MIKYQQTKRRQIVEKLGKEMIKYLNHTVILTIEKTYCLSNAFWIYQHRIKSAPFQFYSSLLLIILNRKSLCVFSKSKISQPNFKTIFDQTKHRISTYNSHVALKKFVTNQRLFYYCKSQNGFDTS